MWRARELASSERIMVSNPDRVLAAAHTNVTKPQEIPVKVELEKTRKSNGFLSTERQQWLGFSPK